MDKISIHQLYSYQGRSCRVATVFPKKCDCGNCTKDYATCDIIFVDNEEFKRGINADDLTDPNSIHDIEVPETSQV